MKYKKNCDVRNLMLSIKIYQRILDPLARKIRNVLRVHPHLVLPGAGNPSL